jgi:hypothetical protein
MVETACAAMVAPVETFTTAAEHCCTRQGRIRSAEKCCQMFNGSFEADTAARMRYQSGPQLFA